MRWRRARGPEQTQLAWFAFAVAALVVALLPNWPTGLNTVILVVTVPLLPLSMGAAILRGHLYGIEVVVRRSLVYGTLSVVLVLGYAATVAALGALLSGRSGTAAALVATALVAVAFAPVRLRAQQGVDRLLYGEGRDPYAVLSGVGRRLEQPVEDPELGARRHGPRRLPTRCASLTSVSRCPGDGPGNPAERWARPPPTSRTCR